VSPFLSRAEEILETALIGCEDLAVVIGRRGEIRMLDPAGWSLPGMRAEFGAEAVYKVERLNDKVRVEGWDGTRSCRLERSCPRHPSRRVPDPGNLLPAPWPA